MFDNLFANAPFHRGNCRSCGASNIMVSKYGRTKDQCRRCIWKDEHQQYQHCRRCAFEIARGRPPLAKCHACYLRNWYPGEVTRRPPIPCEGCGEPFKPLRTDAKFCSNACRQAAYRRGKKAAP